ncbi:hypothetical protein BJ166DRAFT_509680 [Pestalotiopsis sp. NC0098]|nr:hypothetical protein BJ166DRAFT_509680 [Pestalotiopsis sp. NC0098]
MSHFSRDSVGSGSLRGHKGASFGGQNAMRHHPYDRSPPPSYDRSPPRRARQSRLSGENVTRIPLARSVTSAIRPPSWVEGDDMGTAPTCAMSSASRPPSWYEGDDMDTLPTRTMSSAARPSSWFQGDDIGGLPGRSTNSDYMRGAPWADMNRAGSGPGGHATASSAGPGFTGPPAYDHHQESGHGRSRAYVPPSTSFPAPRLSAREEEMVERYWNAEPAPSGHITDGSRELGAHPHMYAGPNGVPAGSQSSRFQEHLEGQSGNGYAIPRRPVPGHEVSGYETHARQPEAGLDSPNPHWPAMDGLGLSRRQAIRRPQAEAETLAPDHHWPATGGSGLTRRQAIRRPQPSEGMRRREELHRRREESRRRRSSDRGVMPEGTGSGASPREMPRPRPRKQVRFATEVERFSRGW